MCTPSITKSETSQFESKFSNDADKVLEAIGSSLHRTLGILDSLSVTYVSHARDQNDTWPFVTLPDFGARMAKLLPLTDSILVALMPIIYPETRKEWEAYSVNNDGWVNQSIKLQETWSGYYGPIEYNWEPHGTIFGDYGDIEANVSNNPTIQAESEAWIDWFQDYIPPNENPFEPVADLYYPVVNEIDRVDLSATNGTTMGNDTVVALLAVQIYWRNFIRNILPPGSNGILVVVECPCNEIFTYQISGSEVNFLGIGDAHDRKYGHLEKRSKLVDLKKFYAHDTIYTGAPIDEDFCPYTVHLYPSDLMKSDFQTKNAVIFMVSTICIFLFTSLVFYLYDWKVERRQNRVVSTAQRSTALLSNLFPSTVRDQLYQSERDGSNVDQRKWKLSVPFMDSSPSNDPKSEPITASPIAQLYTDTSVIFMDIVGFTHWSAARQPSEVFELLETIYGRFDALAKVHGVFKIETIGDCYVAVVGLPVSRKLHAVIMARFAHDCRENMKEVMVLLGGKLGQGTTDLALRVGINSGPTTAGVLRGEKARFQLFGDTVNTAARMESNGEANKIQVSESTAMLIQSAGFGQWLTERPDKVIAKGKGSMQTYWCEPGWSVDEKSTLQTGMEIEVAI